MRWWQWLLAWFAVSIPVGVLAGRWMRAVQEADEIYQRVIARLVRRDDIR